MYHGRDIYPLLANMSIMAIVVMMVDVMLLVPEMRAVSTIVMVLVMVFLIMLLMTMAMSAAMAIVVGQCGQGQSQQSG
jgi:hypothetical protein